MKFIIVLTFVAVCWASSANADKVKASVNVNLPDMPNMPGMPKMTGMPGMPGIPSIPSIPNMPRLPKLHGLTKARNMVLDAGAETFKMIATIVGLALIPVFGLLWGVMYPLNWILFWCGMFRFNPNTEMTWPWLLR